MYSTTMENIMKVISRVLRETEEALTILLMATSTRVSL